jgi:hypothetical protein
LAEQEKPNIFIALDIDPTKAWNQAAFESKLKAKQHEWAKNSQIPAEKGLEAKKNLELLPEYRKIAANEVLRKQQAQDAKKQQKQAQEEVIRELQESLRLLEARGYVLEVEVKNLGKKFVRHFDEAEIRKQINVPIKTKEKTSRAKKSTIDRSNAKKIRALLKLLDKTDLYDFLELNSGTQTHILKNAAENKYAEFHKKPKNSENENISELCGFCKDLFKSDSSREKYDETLRQEQFEKIVKKVDLAGSVSRRVSSEQLNMLLAEAKAAGLDIDETLDIIQERAIKKGFSTEISSNAQNEIKKLVNCGYCQTQNIWNSNKPHCINCGEPLQENCPKCEDKLFTEDRACAKCGFPIGNRVYVLQCLGIADQAKKENNYERAGMFLRDAQNGWPAKNDNPISQKMDKFGESILPKLKEINEIIKDISKSISQKKYYYAKNQLTKLEALLLANDPRIKTFDRQIKSEIDRAEAKIREARQIADDTEAAIRLYQAALRVCADCQEARYFIEKTPPEAPTNLKAKRSSSTINLTWEASPSSGVSYIVMRQEKSRPISVKSGQEIGKVGSTIFDDVSPPIGVPLYYGVFCDREDVFSKQGAITEQPVLVIKNVSSLTANIDNQKITLKWNAPSNVRNTIVARSEDNHPKSPREGVPIQVVGTGYAVDKDVRNGIRYYYSVFAQFEDEKGRLVSASGEYIDVVPQKPPQPIRSLTFKAGDTLQASNLLLSWENPKKGIVYLLRSTKPLALNCGDVIPQDELRNHGKVLSTTSNQYKDSIRKSGFYYYLPVVVFEKTAYIGQVHEYTSVDDITDLVIDNIGHSLRLRWRWPSDCKEVYLVYQHAGWSKPNEKGATTIRLTHAQYEILGHYDIQNPLKQDYYFVVYAVIRQDGQKVTASGSSDGSRALFSLLSKLEIRYEIKKSIIGRKFIIQLNIDGGGTLPRLVLTEKQNSLPMNKNDGETVLITEKQSISHNRIDIAMPKIRKQHRSYVRLFTDDPSLSNTVTILHPSREKLRLA